MADMLAILIVRAKEDNHVGGLVPHLFEGGVSILQYAFDGGVSILQYADDTILFMEHD
jgi:hypothetical protein